MTSFAAIVALVGGGGGVIALVVFLLHRNIRRDGASAERQKIEAASAARAQRQNEVLQREVSDDELRKSLRDGTF